MTESHVKQRLANHPDSRGSPNLAAPRSRTEAALDVAVTALCAIVASDSPKRHFEIARKAVRDIEILRGEGQ